MPDSLLCVYAHPDDESRLCGGILAHLAAHDVAVHLLCLTRGEGGELGEPPLATRETLGQVREQELRCAADALGAASLTLLDYVDPVVGEDDVLYAPDHDPATLSGQIAAAIRQHGAQVVLTHGSEGEYGHPAHVLVHQMALAAVQSLGDAAPLLYGFSAHYPEHAYPRLTNQHSPAHFVLDVSRYLVREVLAATLCHRTQHALFVRRQSQRQGRPVSVAEVVALIAAEGVHRYWPPVLNGRTPDDRFIGWLRRGG